MQQFSIEELQMQQLNYTWLPAATPESDDPLQIIGTSGSYLQTRNHGQLYDAISSWWCKPLGHRHELVINSITKQLECFGHHIPANAYNTTIEQLSNLLVNIFTEMDKVIYASDGSSAVEIAMKLSYETRVLQGKPERSKFIALKNGYHGETIFTLSICGIENYKTNYSALIPENYFIEDIVYVNSTDDDKWQQANFDQSKLENFFAKHAAHLTALVIEPIVQGAGGLKIISRDYLIQLITLARRYGMHIIADEIMVGLGRLGYMSVSKEVLNYEPDLVCFAKNLTAGSIPMSCVVVNHKISQIYREQQQIFPHSHTHSCNTLAAAVAVNYIQLLNNSPILNQVKTAEIQLKQFSQRMSQHFSFILEWRVIGGIAAWELNLPAEKLQNIFRLALGFNLYLRPIENVLYIMPPIYNILEDLKIILPQIEHLFEKLAVI